MIERACRLSYPGGGSAIENCLGSLSLQLRQSDPVCQYAMLLFNISGINGPASSHTPYTREQQTRTLLRSAHNCEFAEESTQLQIETITGLFCATTSTASQH
eukprot:3794865-Amphidinium_carterae.3